MFSVNHGRRARPSVGVGLAGLLLCGALGCGRSEPFETLPVSGKMAYEDGTLISAVRVKIVFKPQVDPVDAKTYPRPGMAVLNVDDGTFGSDEFQATTLNFGDGLTVGPHKVEVFGVFSTDEDKENEIPLEVTPSEIEVGPGSTEFDFKVKRP